MTLHITLVLVLAAVGLFAVALIPLGAWFGRPDVVKGSALVVVAVVVGIVAVAATAPA